MPAPDKVLELIEKFNFHREAYLSGHYSEAQVRLEFIDPFFKALGWDMYNERGWAEAYKEVIHEDAIKVGGATKAPDYCFRVGGVRKYFVEAKKPSVDIRHGTSPAYQLRRYAWSAKLPLSILTDFEEFAVYDCRVRPVKTDTAAKARTMYLKYKDYERRWEDITSVFSREAIFRGSFDKYVESTKKKRGTTEVNEEFLKEIETWREILARNIALRNPKLTRRELNYAVQRTIDRIIFLRICEDRGVEDYGQLMALLNGSNVYSRLGEIFLGADDRYNSGLFHFKEEKGRYEAPDELTLKLKMDDNKLQAIVKDLYYPDSPYEFSVLPADILGQVYEQFLGKVIRLTPAHRAVVEDKPEVKKAGGVYYTPTYIVGYIVENTVGKLLEGKKPRGVSKLRILDPACGSGSFLIGAYQYLLDWHLEWYSENDPEKWAGGRNPRIYQGPGKDWRLTTGERKRILLNNIYGVDIDPQAVEVTKLSLLLKVLEGENEQTLAKQLQLFQERALPDLSDNIKCGNSLIGPDFHKTQETLFLDEEEFWRVNAFKWQTEFPMIYDGNNPGFDVVIGNPPYLRIQGLTEHYGNQIDYFKQHFRSAIKRFDLSLLFIEKGFTLLRMHGHLGFICPHKFVNSDFGSGLREFLASNLAPETFISFGNNLVFEKASTYTGILLLRKGKGPKVKYYEFPSLPKGELPSKLTDLNEEDFCDYDLGSFSGKSWVLTSGRNSEVLNKVLLQKLTLGDIFKEILVGVQTGIDDIHLLKDVGTKKGEVVRLYSEKSNNEVNIEMDLLKPFLRGEDVKRFKEPKPYHYCIYPYKAEDGKTKILEEHELKDRFPLGYEYLSRFRSELQERRIKHKTNPKYWYSCHRPRDMRVFERNRIITPEISLGCNMTICPSGIYHNTKAYSLLPKHSLKESNLYWLALLNSQLMWWFVSSTGYVLRGGYYTFNKRYIETFPIRAIEFSNIIDVSYHDRIVELVEQMLDSHRLLDQARTPGSKTAIQRQIEATERQIDKLVYELYNLAEEEIKIVEETTR